ncbi:DUF6492 family protein [Thermocoleostomius sinensis]|jgi:hypothetical protein|uniref:DUF6492 family protein n=1 Tax=Thermocoleostomius sinensis A174 TaxID=2016057 RepID=A0A9E9C9E2_9CYAN|nr:DUF6492 family protein [Thermocoleostomius sinensis]WAL61473.1 DUF6492 family protein [Thermocoleostomius sinensis A174]
MTTFRFSLITPSYKPDFERCQLLCRSIEKFAQTAINHYIVVDRQDLALFRQLQGAQTHIVTKEEIVPWWIKRLPRVNAWLNFRGLPIRGWILQQIIKLAMAETITDEVLVFIDSDVFFIRPFNLEDIFIQDDKVRLFRIAQRSPFPEYEKTAIELLGIPAIPSNKYIGQIVSWKRDNVLKLHRHIEAVSGKHWIAAVASHWHLSEYVLYGAFVDYILQEQAGHYYDEGAYCLGYWKDVPLSKPQLEEFCQRIQPEHIAVMVSAKAGMTPDDYATSIEEAAYVTNS